MSIRGIFVMIKVPSIDDQRKAQLQKQSFIAQTRLNLATQFLNTMIGRADADINNESTIDALPSLALDYADSLMIKMGMIIKTPVE